MIHELSSLKIKPSTSHKSVQFSSESGSKEDSKEFDPENDVLFSYPKSKAEKMRIMEAVKEKPLFSSLNETQLRVVVNAMEKRSFSRGGIIIKQGDVGDYFYILDSGSADCFVKQANDSDPKSFGAMVKQFKAGDSFGELALLHNKPRAATIIATSDCGCWCLDRVTFRRTLMSEEGQRQRRFEKFLKQVPLFEGLTPYQHAKIADALQEKTVEDGEYIIRQGDPGDTFYVISEGQVKITKMFELGEEPRELLLMGIGKVFGERALLFDQPRAANVISVGKTKLVYLNRTDFNRLLGDVVDRLKEAQILYEKLEKKAGK
jgi:cAMP-dependent protein kinase regulator